jgi:hypothetical protein
MNDDLKFIPFVFAYQYRRYSERIFAFEAHTIFMARVRVMVKITAVVNK